MDSAILVEATGVPAATGEADIRARLRMSVAVTSGASLSSQARYGIFESK